MHTLHTKFHQIGNDGYFFLYQQGILQRKIITLLQEKHLTLKFHVFDRTDTFLTEWSIPIKKSQIDHLNHYIQKEILDYLLKESAFTTLMPLLSQLYLCNYMNYFFHHPQYVLTYAGLTSFKVGEDIFSSYCLHDNLSGQGTITHGIDNELASRQPVDILLGLIFFSKQIPNKYRSLKRELIHHLRKLHL